jgi:protocatechuate 3,4-dioxygenase beta subunit
LLFAAAEGGSPLTTTHECGNDDEPTPSQTAGPFFTPRSPERTSFVEKGTPGTRLELTGRVFGAGCKPIAGALLDFWHTDDAGDYDNAGFRMRGHQHTDAQGRYRLMTIVPGVYPGRTRHIHVRVQPRAGRILTTQLYFPGETRNRRDGIFAPELLIAMDPDATPRRGRFHFVLG